MNDQTNIPTTTNSHVQLLADWRAARNTACKYADGSEEEMRYYDLSEEISVQLATLLATTGEDLIAQITWLQEDSGDDLIPIVGGEQAKTFDTLKKSAANITK